MRKIFIKDIFNILLLSLIYTYKDELTLMVGASLRLAGRYEPYGLICRWLNVKRPGRCAPYGAQGGGCCTWHFHIQQNIVYNSMLSYIPTKRNQLSTDVRRSPFLSRTGNVLRSFLSYNFWIFAFYRKTFLLQMREANLPASYL